MVPNFGFMSVSFESPLVCLSRGDDSRGDLDASHSSPDRKRQKPGLVRLWSVSISCIPAGRWWKRFGARLTKWKGPDVVRLSDVTELRVFKGQAELLDKCHRHHIDIWVVFLMR